MTIMRRGVTRLGAGTLATGFTRRAAAQSKPVRIGVLGDEKHHR